MSITIRPNAVFAEHWRRTVAAGQDDGAIWQMNCLCMRLCFRFSRNSSKSENFSIIFTDYVIAALTTLTMLAAAAGVYHVFFRNRRIADRLNMVVAPEPEEITLALPDALDLLVICDDIDFLCSSYSVPRWLLPRGPLGPRDDLAGRSVRRSDLR